MKKNVGNLVQYELLFQAEDKKGNSTRPDLLLYYKGIFTCLLANQGTSLDIVYGTRAIIYRVVSHSNSKVILF